MFPVYNISSLKYHVINQLFVIYLFFTRSGKKMNK